MKAEFRPASQNFRIESGIFFLSAGKIWQVRADGVRKGHFSVAVCVDRIYSPFGIAAVIVLALAGWMFSQFEVSQKNDLRILSRIWQVNF